MSLGFHTFVCPSGSCVTPGELTSRVTHVVAGCIFLLIVWQAHRTLDSVYIRTIDSDKSANSMLFRDCITSALAAFATSHTSKHRPRRSKTAAPGIKSQTTHSQTDDLDELGEFIEVSLNSSRIRSITR